MKINKNEYENKILWGVIGATFALNFFIKPTYIAVWMAFGIIQFIYSIKEKKIKELLKYVFYIIIGILVVTIPIMIYLVLNNDINDFINAFFVMNMKYSKAGILLKAKTFWILINGYKYLNYIVIGFICNVLILFSKKLDLKNKLFINIFFLILHQDIIIKIVNICERIITLLCIVRKRRNKTFIIYISVY